jgi:hypothetical protein
MDLNAAHKAQFVGDKPVRVIDTTYWLSANWVGHIMAESFILQDYNPSLSRNC